MSAHELDHKYGEDIQPAPVALHDLERQDSLDKGISRLDATDLVTDAEENDLKRGLAQRHVSMIALAGECPEEGLC
jgi:amino acid transporter